MLLNGEPLALRSTVMNKKGCGEGWVERFWQVQEVFGMGLVCGVQGASETMHC